MIYVRGEGEKIRQGLNIYPSFEWFASRGFIFRIGPWQYRFRYAPYTGRWHRGWERWR